MSALGKVRVNNKIFQLMEGHSTPYWTGVYRTQRDRNLAQARNARRHGDRGMAKLFVDFARDDHRKFMDCLAQMRRTIQARHRMASYQEEVTHRVLGLLS